VYTTYYSIKGEPFLNKPSPSLFFDSTVHSRAWQFLEASLDSQEPHLMITGEYGAGKTLLSLKLASHLKQQENQPFAYISTPMQSYLEVLRRIYSALDLGEIDETSDEEALHYRIYRHFETHQHSHLIVILDDVQEYDARQLNQIRLLSTFSHDGFFPIRLFLFANTAFTQRLNSQDLRPLDQRIKRRYHLKNLVFSEAKEYIYFQLIKAGAKGSPVFLDESIEYIVNITEGTPRRINNICDMCLLTGSIQGTDIINLDIVREAAANLGWETTTAEQPLHDTPTNTSTQHGTKNIPTQPDPTPKAPNAGQPIYPQPTQAPPEPVDVGLGGGGIEVVDIDYKVWGFRLAMVAAITTILSITISM